MIKNIPMASASEVCGYEKFANGKMVIVALEFHSGPHSIYFSQWADNIAGVIGTNNLGCAP